MSASDEMPDVLASLQRRRDADAAGWVHDRHYTDWIPVLNELRAEKNDEEGLALLMECIDAAERSAAIIGQEPAPGYTRRAAVILRRQGRLEEEIALIERWERACPPERRSPGVTQSKLEERKSRAGELLGQLRSGSAET